MAKTHGKVISIPAKEVAGGVKVGTQVVFTTDDKTKLALKIDKIIEGNVWPYQLKYNGSTFYAKLEELEVLVVRYDKSFTHSGAFRGTMVNIPLKNSQWQSSLEKGEVNSGKEIHFELLRQPYDANGNKIDYAMESSDTVFEYAKIIPAHLSNAVSMSVFDFDIAIARAYNAGKQAMLDQKDGKPFRSSIEYFKEEFPDIVKLM